MMRRFVAPAFMLLIAACTPASNAPAAPASETAAARHPVSGLPIIPVEIESGGKVLRFTAEYASEWPELKQGLMFRTALAPDEGMIFDYSGIYDRPRVLSYWMKNTVIPLDIIFIAGDGRIVNVAASAVPYSTRPILSGAPAIAALEIPGGRAAELGIVAGDTVRFMAPTQ